MPNSTYPRPARKRSFNRWFALFLLGGIFAFACFGGLAQKALAPVEVRTPWPPEVVMGSDGHAHLAYELHITNFYGDTGVLRLNRLAVFADDSRTPLAIFDDTALGAMVSPHLAEGAKPGDNLARARSSSSGSRCPTSSHHHKRCAIPSNSTTCMATRNWSTVRASRSMPRRRSSSGRRYAASG